MGDGEPRTDRGNPLPTGERRRAPSPDHDVDRFSVSVDRYSMSAGIRNLIVAWGAGPDQRDDEERLEAIRKGARFARPGLLVVHDDR